jgi:hypothetical protein
VIAIAALAFTLAGIHVGSDRVIPVGYELSALAVTMGTSPGFTDRYPSFFHGQNVDITHVPAGIYDLVHRVNANLQLRELRYENDAASVRLRLSWIDGRPVVKLLRSCPASTVC